MAIANKFTSQFTWATKYLIIYVFLSNIVIWKTAYTYALHYSQHNACEFSNNLITYKSDNLTFNDNSLCKVWRKFVCTAYQENWIISPRKHVNKNVQKKLLSSFDGSFRWGNKKFRVMSPLNCNKFIQRIIQNMFLKLLIWTSLFWPSSSRCRHLFAKGPYYQWRNGGRGGPQAY
jgi:hypothetical protein